MNLRYWLALALLLTFARPTLADKPAVVPPEAVGLKAEGLRQIDAYLADKVEKRQLAGAVALLARRGQVGYFRAIGQRDREAGADMPSDALFRMASMTKPVTSVAAMILVEEGKLALTDPVAKYLPEFKDARVLVPAPVPAGTAPALIPVPAERPVTVHHLLTHTSGIPYRFSAPPPLAQLYAKAEINDGLAPSELTLAENVRRIGGLPLAHQPGAAWTYGLNTDVLGRVVEAASGQDLETFFRTRIFGPLKMADTGFVLPTDKAGRLAVLYMPGPDQRIERTPETPQAAGPVIYSAAVQSNGARRYYSGGAGLMSTAHDYARFLQMLLNGGELDGVRLLKPETVRRMTQNQIGALNCAFAIHGDKFGYGFGVQTAAGKDKSPMSVGSYSWAGVFDTFFWVDPEKQLVGIVLTQLFPFTHIPLWADYQKLAYGALGE